MERYDAIQKEFISIICPCGCGYTVEVCPALDEGKEYPKLSAFFSNLLANGFKIEMVLGFPKNYKNPCPSGFRYRQSDYVPPK